jgi:hypothetical protein
VKRLALVNSTTHAAISPTGEILGVGSLSEAEVLAREVSDTVMVDPGAAGASHRENPEPAKTATHALKVSGLQPISQRAVQAMSLEEAHARVAPFFRKLRWFSKKISEKKARWHIGVDSAQVNSPKALAEGLLTENYKIAKRIAGMDKTVVMGLSLMPHALLQQVASSDEQFSEFREDVAGLAMPRGHTLCAGSNAQCRAACLVYAGHNWMVFYNAKLKAAKTLALLAEPVAFTRMLLEACRAVERSRAAHHFIRLNVLSDIPWELVAPWIFEEVGVGFYDYTKVPGREVPDNYDLTFSFSGTNEAASRRELARGTRIAVVFLGMRERGGEWTAIRGAGKRLKNAVPMPKEFWGVPVVDGDESDLRSLDPGGVVVGLRFKTPFGQEVDPAASDFSFVTPAYVVGDSSSLVRPARNPPEREFLVSTLASRATPFQVDETIGPADPKDWPRGEDVVVDQAGELGL